MIDMPLQSDYHAWKESGSWIRISVRAIIFSQDDERILVEQNFDEGDYYNFIGGGVEVGERLVEALLREIGEESDAEIADIQYAQVFENLYEENGKILHGLEHYFLVRLKSEKIISKQNNTVYQWIAVSDLGKIDLRPEEMKIQIFEKRISK
jgi:8-oxo-dGTP pyrophosphatase MutT (NUDIX family)